MDGIPSLETLLKEKKISHNTYDKVLIAKKYIEKKYSIKTLKKQEWTNIIAKINSLGVSNSEKEKIIGDIVAETAKRTRVVHEKLTIRNYESISIIGKGAFGEVRICRDKRDGSIVAVKKIKKETLVQKNQILHTRNEQQFLARVKSPWIVELKSSFQEGDFLFLIMDYCPGGDLMNLLIKRDIFTENEARFYIAEIILAVEEIHKLDCIHRDIKPDNILIDKNGHLKMSDFGLSKVGDKIYEKDYNYLGDESGNLNLNILKVNENNENNNHTKSYSCVGTVYYVAPEVLQKKGYDRMADWWSVGTIFYEMLVGYAPFCAKQTNEACHKILNWKKYLKIPSKAKVSRDAEDLIRKLIADENVRLGKNGANEIKAHPFFRGFDWNGILNVIPPFVPDLKNDYDSSYFETVKENEPFYPSTFSLNQRKDVEYLGYTYKEGDENITSTSDYVIAMEIINKYKKKPRSSRNKEEGGSEKLNYENTAPNRIIRLNKEKETQRGKPPNTQRSSRNISIESTPKSKSVEARRIVRKNNDIGNTGNIGNRIRAQFLNTLNTKNNIFVSLSKYSKDKCLSNRSSGRYCSLGKSSRQSKNAFQVSYTSGAITSKGKSLKASRIPSKSKLQIIPLPNKKIKIDCYKKSHSPDFNRKINNYFQPIATNITNIKNYNNITKITNLALIPGIFSKSTLNQCKSSRNTPNSKRFKIVEIGKLLEENRTEKNDYMHELKQRLHANQIGGPKNFIKVTNNS